MPNSKNNQKLFDIKFNLRKPRISLDEICLNICRVLKKKCTLIKSLQNKRNFKITRAMRPNRIRRRL